MAHIAPHPLWYSEGPHCFIGHRLRQSVVKSNETAPRETPAPIFEKRGLQEIEGHWE